MTWRPEEPIHMVSLAGDQLSRVKNNIHVLMVDLEGYEEYDVLFRTGWIWTLECFLEK
jgi:hypothetical protein